MSEFALKKLTDLELDSKEKSKYIPTFASKLNQQKQKRKEYKSTFKDTLLGFVFGAFLISIAVFAIIGLIKVIRWIFTT